jgi:hypothetical protein
VGSGDPARSGSAHRSLTLAVLMAAFAAITRSVIDNRAR